MIGVDASRRADALHCERIVRAHARTFTLASYFLPAPKRRAAYALYAFCRVADDLVDVAADASDAAVTERVARQLAEYGRQLTATFAGRPSGPVFRELAWVAREYGVPEGPLRELLDGVARDLRPVRYETWPDLARYCAGVASSVGEMCTHVFGVPNGPDARARAVRYARTLGVAMQLTNVLRDVGEDARRGRCYLPDEDLATFGIAREEVLRNPALPRDERWRPLMAFQVGRARALYEAALPGVALLAPDARRCTAACAAGYAAILSAIEQNGYDTVSTRARLGHWARAAVLWEVWRARPGAGGGPVGDGPYLEWERTGKADTPELVKWA
jgi:15-cis-phytoene synthase